MDTDADLFIGINRELRRFSLTSRLGLFITGCAKAGCHPLTYCPMAGRRGPEKHGAEHS